MTSARGPVPAPEGKATAAGQAPAAAARRKGRPRRGDGPRRPHPHGRGPRQPAERLGGDRPAVASDRTRAGVPTAAPPASSANRRLQTPCIRMLAFDVRRTGRRHGRHAPAAPRPTAAASRDATPSPAASRSTSSRGRRSRPTAPGRPAGGPPPAMVMVTTRQWCGRSVHGLRRRER